jgi:hypothetical protein
MRRLWWWTSSLKLAIFFSKAHEHVFIAADRREGLGQPDLRSLSHELYTPIRPPPGPLRKSVESV